MRNKIKWNLMIGPAVGLALAGVLLGFQNCSSGGGGNGTSPTPTPTPIGPSLSTSLERLHLKVSGTARTISITNTGGSTAISVTYSTSPALPGGTTISPADCGDIAVGDNCLITVTPGATLSAAVGDTNAVPVVLTIQGSNTNAPTVDLNIVDYGSVVQGGYVFSIDDSTPTDESIAGKAASTVSNGGPSLVWSSDGDSGGQGDVVYDNVSETVVNRTTPCVSNTDGKCNTQYISAFYPTVNNDYYAAGKCKQSINGYSDWYLPAICELGYDNIAANCGTQMAPLIDNMQSRLLENGDIGTLGGPNLGTSNQFGYRYHWSSTTTNASNAVAYVLNSPTSTGGTATDVVANKNMNAIYVRCARLLN